MTDKLQPKYHTAIRAAYLNWHGKRFGILPGTVRGVGIKTLQKIAALGYLTSEFTPAFFLTEQGSNYIESIDAAAVFHAESLKRKELRKRRK